MGTTTIKCVDCDTERVVPNASKHLVKRCRNCQDEYNRTRALERYYVRTGRSMDNRPKKKKKEKKLEPEVTKSVGWLSGPSTSDEDEKERPQGKQFKTPEEAEAFFKSVWEKVNGPGSWDDVATEDDW